MAPLVAFAVSVLPSLAKRVADRVLPDVEDRITEKVRDVLGTSDATAAAEKAMDPQVAAELRVRLAEIEAAADKREQDLQLARMQNAFETFKAELDDTADARGMLATLSSQGSAIAWGPVVVSTIVVTGFFVILILLMVRPNALVNAQNPELIFQVLNIAIGALTAGFATVVSFWLGSSQGSRNKDANALEAQTIVARLQRDNATSTKALMEQQTRQTEALIQKVALNTAIPAPPPVLAATTSQAQKTPRHFHRCVEIVLQHEGGYSEHPDDPGGATNFGITHRTLAAWRKVDACTREDMQQLEEAEAIDIYRALYWNALNCDQLPMGVDLVTFDFGVNAGVSRAARTLQGVLAVKTDGQIGPITLAAAQRMEADYVINTLSDVRLDFYKGLSTWSTFGRGWSRRTSETRRDALRLAGDAAVG